MSKWQLDGIGESFEVAPNVHIMVYHLDGKGRVVWQITAMDGDGGTVHLIENEDEFATEEDAEVAGLEAAAALGKRIEAIATAELRRFKQAAQAAQDADDAAIVAAHGEVVWVESDWIDAALHCATVAGHPCCVTDRGAAGIKWELEPEHTGHPYTWDAPDVETAKIRAAAAALRSPCKRWLVEIPAQNLGARAIKGGSVEVWAVTGEGALYRACAALDIYSLGREVKHKATEVAG